MRANEYIQYVPESQRTEEWCKSVADSLLDGTSAFNYDRERIYQCRRMYKAGIYNDNYDYLYGTVTKKIEDDCGNIKTVHLQPPAKVRHIPIVKPAIRILVGEEKDRPKVFRAFTTDADNSTKKEDAFIQDINVRVETKIRTRMQAYQLQQQLIATQQQVIQQMAQDPQAQQYVMQLQQELERVTAIVTRGIELESEELEKLVKYYRYSYRDIQEVFAEKVCEFHISDQRLERLINRGFEERLVTGKEVYFCDWTPGMEDPVYDLLYWENVYFPFNEHVQYLHEHSWGIRRERMSLDNIIAYWGQRIDRKLMDEIKSEMKWDSQVQRTGVYHTPDGVLMPVEQLGRETRGDATTGDEYDVSYCYWKAHVRVPVLESKNKHRKESAPFIKYISEEEAETLMSNKKRMESRDQKITWYYREDLYKAVRVGKYTYLEAGKHPVQLRSETKRSTVALPFIGHADNYYHSTDSLIWETRDLQELYNIFYYQKELLTVLSGVKGMIADISQLPENVSLDEAILYMKQGIFPIETIGEDGRPKNSSFNQFGSFDQTISPAVSAIDASLIGIKQLVGELTGVTDVRAGIVKPSDQVGTSQLSYNQSSMSTERYFQDHEDLFELLLSRGANLSKLAYKNGKKGQYINGDRIMERLNIPESAMEGEYKVMMQSGRKEAALLQQMQQIAQSQYGKGQINGSQYLQMIDAKSIVEIKKLIAEHEELAMKMAQSQQQQNFEQQQQLQQQKAQLDQQTKQLMEQTKLQVANIKAQIDQQKLQLEAQKLEQDGHLTNKGIDITAQTKKYEVDMNTSVEMAYLQLQQQELAINDQNQKTAMLLDSVQKQIQLRQSKEKIKD